MPGDGAEGRIDDRWVPHSISCSSRTFGNAPRPRVLREAIDAAWLAGLSGTSSRVASHDTSRSPDRTGPGRSRPA